MYDVGGTPVGEAGLSGRAAAAEVLLRRAFQTWEGLLERLPIGVYVCDRKGAVIQFNSRAVEMWGGKPPPPGGRAPFERSFHPDGSPMSAEQSPVGVALATGAPVKDREVVILHLDGRRSHLLANVEPLFDEAFLQGRRITAPGKFEPEMQVGGMKNSNHARN